MSAFSSSEATQESRVNEARYRALVEAISTFVWIADARGNFASPQPGWKAYTGHGFEQHGGNGWINDVHPGDRAHVMETWTKAVRSKSWYEVAWRCWHGATRRWRQCLTRGVPILDVDGAVYEWIGAVTDIEHQLSLDQVFEREWLGTAQRTGGLVMWEWRIGTGDVQWTPELYQIWGVPAGSTISELIDCIRPEDYGKVQASSAEAAKSGALDVTFRITGQSGTMRWVRAKGSVVPDHASGKMVGVLVDVTDLVQLQESYWLQVRELETLIDAIPACVWISRDPECRLILGNRATNEFLGVPAGANLSQTPDANVETVKIEQIGADGSPVPPDELPMQRVARSGKPLFDEEMVFRMADGSTRCLLGNVVPLQDAGGKNYGCIAGLIDITELKHVHEELSRSNRELAFANQQLSQFNFAASHDLREPLRQVAVFSQLLEKRLGSTLDPGSSELLKNCRKGALRMEQLVNDLLAYAQAGMHDGDASEPIDSTRALTKVRQSLALAIQEAQAEIEAAELPMVRMECSSLEHVFQNLISNAIKYRGKSAPLIRISAVREGRFWKFAVQDNGIGIDPKYHESIFAVFQRLHSSGQYEGTGIGLAICQKIVERYGGRIWIESEAGKGSTFYFTVPAA
ncbi:MAG: PAS domain-containing protein [Acidobacteriaceae bacterium]|nr:PAS domain-containing protein [Acidobacteriaceae bacterium]